MLHRLYQRILAALRTLLDQRGIAVDLANVRLAREEDIAHSPPSSWSIPKTKLIDIDQFDRLASLFDGGPSWIHANLILTEGQPVLISITAGAPVGNPTPSLNVSLQEINLTVEDGSG